VVARQVVLGFSGASWVFDGAVSLTDGGFLLQRGARRRP
jgi:hypothetical protein